MTVWTVGGQTHPKQILQDVLSQVVLGQGNLGIQEVALADLLAEEVEGSHQLVVAAMEVPHFVLEVLDQFERGELHEKVRNSPFLVLF